MKRAALIALLLLSGCVTRTETYWYLHTYREHVKERAEWCKTHRCGKEGNRG